MQFPQAKEILTIRQLFKTKDDMPCKSFNLTYGLWRRFVLKCRTVKASEASFPIIILQIAIIVPFILNCFSSFSETRAKKQERSPASSFALTRRASPLFFTRRFSRSAQTNSVNAWKRLIATLTSFACCFDKNHVCGRIRLTR